MEKIHCWKNHVAVTAFALACLLPGGSALGSGGPSRAEFVEAVDEICRQGMQRHGEILRGVDEMVRDGRLQAAGRRFRRAATALLASIRSIGRVRPPAADAGRIDSWLRHGRAGADLLRRIGRDLKLGHRPAAEAKADRLLAEIQRANASVIGFEFDHCRLRPARFV
jgi:hypothetical protein